MIYKIYKGHFRIDGVIRDKEFVGEVAEVKNTIKDTVEIIVKYDQDGKLYYIENDQGLKVLSKIRNFEVISRTLENLDGYKNTKYDIISQIAAARLFIEVEACLFEKSIRYDFNCNQKGQELIKRWNWKRKNDPKNCIGFNTHLGNYLFMQTEEIEDTLDLYDKQGYRLINEK